jgi:hypothetical protein
LLLFVGCAPKPKSFVPPVFDQYTIKEAPTLFLNSTPNSASQIAEISTFVGHHRNFNEPIWYGENSLAIVKYQVEYDFGYSERNYNKSIISILKIDLDKKIASEDIGEIEKEVILNTFNNIMIDWKSNNAGKTTGGNFLSGFGGGDLTYKYVGSCVSFDGDIKIPLFLTS